MTMKLIRKYTKSETCWQNRLDRALPVCFTRYCEVSVYRRKEWDFLGLFNIETESWGPWEETKVNWDDTSLNSKLN